MQAYITGIVPISSVHWTSNTCSTIYFAGCDFRCPFCHTPEKTDFKEDFLVDLREVCQHIKTNAPSVKGVYFTGGEPLLQRQALLSLAKYAKELGLKVGVDTNGSKPSVMNSLIESKLLDFVCLDLKAPFADDIFERVTKSSTFFKPTSEVMNDLHETIDILKENSDSVDVEVKTTIVPGVLFKKEDLLEIAKIVDSLDASWVIQPFSPQKKLVDKRFSQIRPPTMKFLENLKRSCYKEFPNLRIEVRNSFEKEPEIIFNEEE